MSERVKPEPGRKGKYYREKIPQEELRHLYETQGLSLAKIAAVYGCSKQKVSADLAYHQIPARPPGTLVSIVS